MIITTWEKAYEVKPCPFCGKEDAMEFATLKEEEHCGNCYDEDKCPAYRDDETSCGVFIVCNVHKGGCGGSSGWGWNYEDVVEKWNRRSGGDGQNE